MSIPPPAVDIRRDLRVVPGTTAALDLTVHNASASPLDGQLSVIPQGDVPVAAATASVTVLPGQSLPVSVPLQIAAAAPDWWPRSWSVFAPVEGSFDLSKLARIPRALVIGETTIAPRYAVPVNGKIDLKALTGGSAEKRQGICMAEVDVPADLDAEIGASADFWMEWWVNGKSVFSTLSEGNGTVGTLLGHTFPVHLNKGKNLLAVRVLSGQGGWTLVSGGPPAVTAARREREGKSDGAVVELRQGDRVLSRELVKVELVPPPVVDDGGDVTQRPPAAPLGPVTNFHMKDPDSSKWFKGPDDLSGQVWLAEGKDESLRVTVLVRDDIQTAGDGIEIKLASGPGYQHRVELTRASPEVSSARDGAAGVTRYDAIIPRARLSVAPGEMIALQVTVLDDDWGVPKQQASLCAGDDPADWLLTWLAPK